MVVLRPQINRNLSKDTQLLEQNEKSMKKNSIYDSLAQNLSTLSSIDVVLAPNVALVDGIL
jgi:hypothetical protein